MDNNNKLILFYKNKYRANNKNGYLFSDILEWSDYKLETRHDFIQWLFPDETGGVNSNAPILSKNDINMFKTDNELRKNVLKAASRMLQFYGFNFTIKNVVQIKPLERKEKQTYIGLYSEHNYKRLSRMMIFLNKIEMKIVSCLIMLALCKAMNSDSKLRSKIMNSDAYPHWININKYIKLFEEEKEAEVKKRKMEEICRFTGLQYTGNSCYQDSVLLALFAIPIPFITENILEKNIMDIKSEIDCNIKYRKLIQKELYRITENMRNSKIESTCSTLRNLIKNCPSTSGQEFHKTIPQDAGEFLQYLFALFNVQGLVQLRKTIVTNDMTNIPDPNLSLTTFKSKEEGTPIVLISYFKLLQFPEVSTNFFLNQTDDALLSKDNLYKVNGKTYKRRIETVKISNSRFLVFYAQRIGIGNKKLKNKIIPDENILNLSLYSIVVHYNEHYTCYIKCDETWFYYNDLSEKITSIGSYQDMLNEKYKPNIQTNGVLYFYKE